jgi:hypothetical protein
MSPSDPLLAAMENVETHTIGGVQVDIMQAGEGRIKRVIYPPGFNWALHMKPIVGTELCKHAHVGFLARGQIAIRYADGCTVGFAAPQAVIIEPGHDGWVVGDQPAVVIEFDFKGETAEKFGLPTAHQH